MHVEGHIESGSGYSSGGGSGTTSSGPRRTNRTPIGSAGTDMGSGMMGNPTMGGGMMMGIVQSDGSTMTPMGLQSSNKNINLPMSSAIPINVDENIQNLQQIQSFPVAGTGPNGIHFHQDPVTGQMYRMTQEFHQRIPQILASRTPTYTDVVDSFFATDNVSTNGVRNGTYTNGTFVNDSMGISSPFVSKLVNQSLSRLSEPAKPSAIFSMNGEPIINEQKNTNSFYLLFPESSPEIIQRTKNQQFVSNMSNGYNIPIQSQIQSTYEYNIPIQSQIQSTYVQDQISLQEFAIPINKFSDINSQITSQRISQRVVYATNIPVNKFADMGSVSNTTGVVIQSKPISLTKLV